MLTVESFSRETITDILQPITRIYGGADSRVYHVENFAVHYYKPHVDEKLFNLYLQATLNATQLIEGLTNVPNTQDQVRVSVNPILSWFISNADCMISVSRWIDGRTGTSLRNDRFLRPYLSIITPLNEKLGSAGKPWGSEIVDMNMRYNFPLLRNPNCIITDVGSGLRYLRD